MKNKIYTGVCILFGLMFINAGLNKFFNYMPMPANMPESMLTLMNAFMQVKWLMPLVAVVEIVAGLMFFFAKVRALGAIMIFPIMVGIMFTNIFNAPDGILIAIIFFLINLRVIYDNRQKYLPMIN